MMTTPICPRCLWPMAIFRILKDENEFICSRCSYPNLIVIRGEHVLEKERQ